ncbi:MAG: hypothetical protein KDH20_15200 [Rhodocyclaceae bacterium]|nr:hypothetical protein [Rhodocyclaceae bacterium]
MKAKELLFGERSLTKIAGLFPSREAAMSAAHELPRAAAMSDRQVAVVGPADDADASGTRIADKIEPEPTGVGRTLTRAHLVSAAVGAAAGALLFVALMAIGLAALATTPWMSLGAFVFYGATLGLLAGGLLALRPDHSRVLEQVRAAVRSGRWAVIAHPTSSDQAGRAQAVLHARAGDVVRSF